MRRLLPLILLLALGHQEICLAAKDINCKTLYGIIDLYEGEDFENALKANLLSPNLEPSSLEASYSAIKHFTKDKDEKKFLIALAKTLESDSGFSKLTVKDKHKQIDEILYSSLNCKE